jgi:hypothetical protein
VYADTDLAVGRRLGIEGDIEATEAEGIGVDELEF